MSATTIYSAIKARTGATDYFVVQMKAGAAAAHARFAYSNPHPQSIEEAYQRDMDYAAARNHIAPYLAQNKDRFLGAVIFAVKNLSPECFSPLPEAATAQLPMAYQLEARRMGFLTMTDATMIPIDGQHQLKAVEFAIQGKDNTDKVIRGLRPDFSLAREDIAVILIPYDAEKTQNIFAAIKRRAKPAKKHLVTDDDDIVAVIARDIADNVIGRGLVKYKSNSLTAKEGFFTTLSAVADGTLAILDGIHRLEKKDRVNDDPDKLEMHKGDVRDTWAFLAKNIDDFSVCLANKDTTENSPGDQVRKTTREKSLLLQPMPQVCLITAFVRLTNGQDWKLTPKQAAAKLNAINWEKNAELWDRVLISGGKILKGGKWLATELICYMAGEPTADKNKGAKNGLLEKYRAAFPSPDPSKGEKDKPLPPRL